MAGDEKGRGNATGGGARALVAAMFERAWRDVRAGGENARDAELFLCSEVTLCNVTSLGADPGYYRERVAKLGPTRAARGTTE
jgi:hypothetical protein